MEDADTYEAKSQGSFIFTIVSFVESYGWFFLLAAIGGYFLYRKYRSNINEFYQRRSEEEYAARYHKNPDLFNSYSKNQQTYAQKLQEKYNREAEEYKKKLEEKEAKKREEWLTKHNDGGNKLGDSSTSDKSKQFKPEYNPLMGGGSHTYRAPRRSPCGGGGCG